MYIKAKISGLALNFSKKCETRYFITEAVKFSLLNTVFRNFSKKLGREPKSFNNYDPP